MNIALALYSLLTRGAQPLLRAFEEEVPLAGVVAAAPQGLVHRRLQGVQVWDGWLDLRALSFR